MGLITYGLAFLALIIDSPLSPALTLCQLHLKTGFLDCPWFSLANSVRTETLVFLGCEILGSSHSLGDSILDLSPSRSWKRNINNVYVSILLEFIPNQSV